MYGRKAKIAVGDAGSSSGRIACYLLLSKWFDNIRWSDIGKLAGQTAVSYTHLDVYKRQIPI